MDDRLTVPPMSTFRARSASRRHFAARPPDVVGGTMPFIIRRLGGDPAMMTEPILTTITDIIGVTIYLSLATLFLSGLMAG